MSTAIRERKLVEPPPPRFIYLEDDFDTTVGSYAEFGNVDPGTVAWFYKPAASSNFSDYADVDLVDETTANRVTANEQIEEMSQLIALAHQGDKPGFIAAKKAIDWSVQPAQDIVQSLQLALSVGAFLAARQLATQAVEYYPHHSELQQYATLLATPKVTRSNDQQPDPTLRNNQAWLKVNRADYQGQWVALQDGQLLGAAASLRTLVSQVGQAEDILLTKVY